MKKQLHRWLLLISLATTIAKDEQLPLCPTNMQYFPQNLPMHCRMPNPGDFQMPQLPQMPTMTPFLPNVAADKQPRPLPVPVPPFPGMPGAMPMPMPMMPGVPPHKLPVIVMPFYSPDPSAKKSGSRPSRNKRKRPFFKKPPRYDSDTDTSSDTDTDTDTDTETDTSSDTSDTSDSSSEWWKGNKRGFRKNLRRYAKKHKMRRHNKKRKDLLTPLLQYVTKDGYVIFEKKITKNEAKDWLKSNKEKGKSVEAENAADDDNNDANKDNVGNMEQEDPKTDAEELELKEKEKSKEERVESATQKKKKHRYKKPNTLMSQPPQPSP